MDKQIITKPHDLSDAYLVQIGRMAVAGARLEDGLHGLFSLLAAEKPKTPSGAQPHNTVIDVLLRADSLNQRIERLELLTKRTITLNGREMTGAINRVVSDELADVLRGLIKRCRQAKDARNKYVHATWVTDQHGTVLCKTTRNLRTDQVPVTLDDLAATARLVEQAVEAVNNFHFDVLSGKIHTDWGTMPGLDG